MFGSTILDVAIGMVFIFLLLSLIASAAQELVALVIQARSANLLRGIRSMVSNDTLPSGEPFLQTFYNHGLIRSLYQVPGEDYTENPFRARLRVLLGHVRLWLRWLFGMRVPGTKVDVNDLWLPAYIPSRVFAMVLRDILANQPRNLEVDKGTAAESASSTVSGSTLDEVGRPPAAAQPDSSLSPIVRVGTGAARSLAAEALRALVEDANGDANTLQQNLENWYSDAMDRVSGWYKRYTQSVLLVIGLLLAMIFNVSSIRVVRALWVDKDTRTALASQADAYMKEHEKLPKAETGASAAKLGEDLRGTVDAYHETAGILLPIGWKHSPTVYLKNLASEPRNVLPGYLLVLFGWCVTAIALSYGAPFWFDTLNKFMVVRSTIKPQEKSQIEPSKS